MKKKEDDWEIDKNIRFRIICGIASEEEIEKYRKLIPLYDIQNNLKKDSE
jgi:hypothetical protein